MGVLAGRARLATAVPAALLAAALAACAGGGGGGGDSGPLPGPAGRIDPIYDATLSFPDAVVNSGGLTYQGIVLDLEITFDDPTVRDADPRFKAPVRVVAVSAGGVAQTFMVPFPIVMQGAIDKALFDTDLFGSIVFGSANLVVSMTGTIGPGARRIDGTASLYGTSHTGPFAMVRRRRYLVAGSDLSSSVGQVVVVEARYDRDPTRSPGLETTSSDPVARVRDGRPFVVNRLSFDNIQGLDPASGFKTTLQDSTGNGSNPHDLVVLPGAAAGVPAGSATDAGVAFVTRYEPPYDDLALFDLDDGSLLGSIDLVPLATNPDGLPRPDQVLEHDGHLWVTLQDANRSFTDFRTGRLAVIDPVARQVVDVIDLHGQNPFESLSFLPENGLIYVGLAGIFPGLRPQALTGGIEAVDPVTRHSLGLVVDDDALGGNVSGVAVVSPTRGFAVVTDATFRNFIKAFDPSTGAVLGTVYETTDRISCLVSDGDGWVIAAESSFVAPRLLFFDGTDGHAIAALPMQLPPLSVAIMTRGL
jgi:hypothetical protein